MMRFPFCVFLAYLLAAGSAAAPAFAEVQTGNEVTVNPIAGSGNGVLLYPGGQYMRTVRPLLQPGEKTGAIQLHMPVKRSARVPATPSVRTAVAAPPRESAPPPPRETPRPAPPAKRVAVAPPRENPPPTPASSFGAAGLELARPTAIAPPSQTQIAKAAPPRAEPSAPAAAAGLTKRSVILFAADASEPAQSALGAIKFLAGDLNTAMTGPGSRVQILAYGGAKGDKGSDARRLSLKRALAIRQVLIDDGVGSERIDVRAMGGADDGGPADRVDVYIKA
jgi:outer membrane protein OmpA-like peptidoglycan-associated protein